MSREVRGSRTLHEPMADRFLVLHFIGSTRIVDLFFLERGVGKERESAAEALAAPFPQAP